MDDDCIPNVLKNVPFSKENFQPDVDESFRFVKYSSLERSANDYFSGIWCQTAEQLCHSTKRHIQDVHRFEENPHTLTKTEISCFSPNEFWMWKARTTQSIEHVANAVVLANGGTVYNNRTSFQINQRVARIKASVTGTGHSKIDRAFISENDKIVRNLLDIDDFSLYPGNFVLGIDGYFLNGVKPDEKFEVKIVILRP